MIPLKDASFRVRIVNHKWGTFSYEADVNAYIGIYDNGFSSNEFQTREEAVDAWKLFASINDILKYEIEVAK